MNRTAGFYCGTSKKVIVVVERADAKPPHVTVHTSFCRAAGDYTKQMKLINELGVVSTTFQVGMTFDEYMEKYKYNRATKLF